MVTTIVVHGTLAYGGSWYQSSWQGRGFLVGLRDGMVETSDWHDIWQINDKHVSTYPELGGIFKWNGLPGGSIEV